MKPIYYLRGSALRADEFRSILTGDTYSGVDLRYVVITGNFKISINDKTVYITKEINTEHVTFRGKVDFTKACFQKPVDFKEACFTEEVSFAYTVFEDKVVFAGASFQKEKSFEGAKFRQEVDFQKANFQCLADFNGAKFLQGINFTQASFHQGANFKEARFRCIGDFSEVVFRREANFESVDYHSDEIWKRAWRVLKFLFRKLWRLLNHKGPNESDTIKSTQFKLNTNSIDETTAPIFKRYVADQQYVRSFQQNHRVIHWLWHWSSDCGRSIVLWASWSLLIAFLFALAYTPPPGFLGTQWCNFWQEHGAEFQQMADKYKGKPLNFGSSFYFSIVTFTTLGFGDVVAANTFARFLVTLEVIFGYVMLGGLISIFANKLARRS